LDARPEPSHRLPTRARTLWRLEGALQWGAVLLVAMLVRRADLPDLVRTLLAVLPPAGAAIAVGVVPEVRWRRWRYDVREDEIDLRRGTFTLVRTLVPMARVQHVDTREGVLEQALKLSTVVFHTAAGATTIPALGRGDALAVRDRIASLARTPDAV
jgi:hypothetical protein